jgi:hypothetical protein
MAGRVKNPGPEDQVFYAQINTCDEADLVLPEAEARRESARCPACRRCYNRDNNKAA